MGIIFDGKKEAETLHETLKKRIGQHSAPPSLCILFSEETPEHEQYTRAKEKVAQKLGIPISVHAIQKGTSTIEYTEEIARQAENHTGILIQLPLADHLDQQKIINAIPYDKDVEGMTAIRAGEHFLSPGQLYSPTAKAVLHALKTALHTLNLDPRSVSAALAGFSPLIGKPLLPVLADMCNDVTICRRHTANIDAIIRSADIVISGTGTPSLITPDTIKEKAIVIDAGFELSETGRPIGDTDPAVSEKAAFYTPVPGGIGPLTIAFIFENLLLLAEEQQHGANLL